MYPGAAPAGGGLYLLWLYTYLLWLSTYYGSTLPWLSTYYGSTSHGSTYYGSTYMARYLLWLSTYDGTCRSSARSPQSTRSMEKGSTSHVAAPPSPAVAPAVASSASPLASRTSASPDAALTVTSGQ